MLLNNNRIPIFHSERTSIVERDGIKNDNETVGTEESEGSDPIALALCFDSMCAGGCFDDIEDTSIERAEGVKTKNVQPRSVTLVQSRADGIEVRTFTTEQSRQYSAALIQSYARRFIARRKVRKKREEIRRRRAVSEEAARVGHRRLMRLVKKERRKEEEQKLIAEEKAYNERNRKEKQKIRYKAAEEIRELNRLAADINYIENEIGSDLLPLKLACGGLECVDERRQVPTKAKKKKTKPPIQQVICQIDKKDDSSIVDQALPKEKRNGRIFGLFSKKKRGNKKKVIGEIRTKQWETDYRKDVNYDHRKSPRKSMVEPKSKSNYSKSSNHSSRPKEQSVEIKSKSTKRESRSREPPIGVLIIQPKSNKRVPSSTKSNERPFDELQRR